MTTTDHAGPPLPRTPAALCICGHADVVHDLSSRGARTSCTVHTGPRGTPCPCSRYTKEATR